MKGPFATLSLALTLFSASQISSVEAINLRLRFPGLHLLNSSEAQSTDNPTHLNLRRRAGGLFDSRNDIIVVLKDDEDSRVRKLSQGNMPEIAKKNKEKAAAIAKGLGVQPKFTYGAALYGFSVKGATQAQVQAIEASDAVAYVEMDQMIQLDPMEMQGDVRRRLAPPPGKGPNRGDGGDSDTPPPPQETPWGITRVGGSVDCTMTVCGTAWIIDSGIDLDHPDLNVDISRSASFLSRGRPDANDENGHGTHVAGTVAAVDNDFGVVGVAAGATVVSVRVLDRSGSGSYSGVIAGIDYVGANGTPRDDVKGIPGDAANMSLGGGFSQAVNDAVKTASNTVSFVLAAGNSGDHANKYSPASVNGPNIYTISATDIDDNFAYFSNFGNPPVDYAEPGVSILSTWKGGGYNTISGTSMAAPHFAGIFLATNGSFHTNGNVLSGDDDGYPDDIGCL